MQAFEKAKPLIKKSFKINIYCGDSPRKDMPIFAYSRKNMQKKIIAIPDFNFVNWKECGNPDYEECWREMVEASKCPPVYNTVFWIGNAATHPTRGVLCDIAAHNDKLEVYGMNWKSKEGNNEVNKPTKFISLIDHTKYRYLIDIQGVGWSARTKLLFFSGRPLFLVDRQCKEYWYSLIEPWVHYIPVLEDLSDLEEKIDWAFNNEEEANQIAKNAQQFAINNLKRSDAVDYFAKVILDYANRGL